MTKEFMILDETQKTKAHIKTRGVLVQEGFYGAQAQVLPKPLDVGVRHRDQDVVPS